MQTVEDKKGLRVWQLQQLEQLGCRPEDALVLLETGVDWHELDRLLKAGCDLHTAVRILA